MCYTDNKELIQIPQHSIGSQFIHSSHGQAFKQVSYARAENNLCVSMAYIVAREGVL